MDWESIPQEVIDDWASACSCAEGICEGVMAGGPCDSDIGAAPDFWEGAQP